MITAFAIGTSALQSAQTALNVIGQNISNATTAGYHGQRVNLVTNVTGQNGTGVDVATVSRASADTVETALNAAASDQSSTSAQLSVYQQVQTALNTGTGGIGDQLNSFFNQIDQLTSQPASTPQRQQLISTAATLSGQINTAANAVGQVRASTAADIAQGVAQVNTLAAKIASLNVQIASAEGQGQSPNGLLDQRAAAISSLSQLMNVQTVNQPNGVVNVIGNGAAVVVGQLANSFQVTTGSTGNLVIAQSASSLPVSITSGSLGGQLNAYNTTIPNASSQLDALASTLIQSVNQVQATGLGLTGPQTAVTGTTTAASPTATLGTAGLPSTVQAGQLTVSVTDASGNRTNTTISINPATDTLTSVASALSGVPGLTASVTATNQLQIAAQPGYSFDFAGRDSNPAGSGAVANPDTAGVLSALGINSFFTGSGSSTIAVNPALSANPGLLAASASGQTGDSTNLRKLSALQDKAIISGQTFAQNYTSQGASVGAAITSLTDQQTAQTSVVQNLTTQDQSQTGVNTNEEFVNLLSYQKMIQAASEYFTTANTAYSYILNMIH